MSATATNHDYSTFPHPMRLLLAIVLLLFGPAMGAERDHVLLITIDDLNAIENLVLRLQYDDSFVAYINGVEVARENVSGTPPTWDQRADRTGGNVDGGGESDFDVTDLAMPVLQVGENVLAVQVHNTSLGSSDLVCAPELLNVPAPAR